MRIKTQGVQTQQVNVEVCPFKVIEELLKQELKSIQFSAECDKDYDVKMYQVSEGSEYLKLEELYISVGGISRTL